MSRNRHGGRQHKSRGGSAGGGGGGGRGGGGGGGNRQGKILYDSGDEPAFIRQFKERTGYQAPLTTDDKRQMMNDYEERGNESDYRKDDEKPQIVQLNATDLSKEEVELEFAKAKEAEEEKQCVDSQGRLLFRKPKDKTDESDKSSTKSDIVDVTSNKANKRKIPIAATTSKDNEQGKKSKTHLLSFMDESGFDGDD